MLECGSSQRQRGGKEDDSATMTRRGNINWNNAWNLINKQVYLLFSQSRAQLWCWIKVIKIPKFFAQQPLFTRTLWLSHYIRTLPTTDINCILKIILSTCTFLQESLLSLFGGGPSSSSSSDPSLMINFSQQWRKPTTLNFTAVTILIPARPETMFSFNSFLKHDTWMATVKWL